MVPGGWIDQPHAVQRRKEIGPPSITSFPRLSRASKKDASFDVERYEKLEGQLEYFDLRELQDTIVTKTLWPRFEPLFKNKEALVNKFDQLAEVRNGIRHSRNLSEITRKEGEAALLWFRQILNT
jgi:hypothetical protein